MVDQGVQLAVIGTGYVGLVSGTCFASVGHRVICIDKDELKIAQLKLARIPIYEPTLETLVREQLDKKRLIFDTQLEWAVCSSQVIFIAVGTPAFPGEGRPDLSFVEKVAEEIAPYLVEYKILVIKSTTPLGTAALVKSIIKKVNPNAVFDVVSNPEFLREGAAVYDFMNPYRIIIGAETTRAREMMDKVYKPFILRKIPIVYTDLESATLIKYLSNCFLATKVAFVNEVADLCERVGADISHVTKGLGLDERIGAGFLNPGPGFGGSCFPKDTMASVYMSRQCQAPLTIVESVVHSNEVRKQRMIEKVVIACGRSIKRKKLAILGVAFKANTDDVRESVAIVLIRELQARGAIITAYDPAAMSSAKVLLSDVSWAADPYGAMQGADAVVILTEWQEFCDLDFFVMGTNPLVIDFRNLYDPKTMSDQGIQYVSIGRKVEEQKIYKEVSSHVAEYFDLEASMVEQN